MIWDEGMTTPGGGWSGSGVLSALAPVTPRPAELAKLNRREIREGP